jgi:predicted Zn-dependent protease
VLKKLAVLLIAYGMVFGTVCYSIAEKPVTTDTKAESETDIETCLRKGYTSLDAGNADEAVVRFKRCVEKFPKSPWARYWLGTAYFFARQTDDAVSEFKTLIKMDPDNPLGPAMLGRVYSFEPDKLDAARELLERSLAAQPDSEDTRFDLARVYAQKGELDKAFAQFKTILAGESRFALYRTELAKIMRAAGALDEAKIQLKRALAISPDFAPAKQMLTDIEKEQSTAKPSIDSAPAEKESKTSK